MQAKEGTSSQMNPGRFRELALGLQGALQSEHMNHADFRVGRRIFATLGYPYEGWGMVKLTPAQQASFVKKARSAFRPAAGAWGLKGSTIVHLASAKESDVRRALDAAHRNLAKPTEASR
jgi:hypothetical protein